MMKRVFFSALIAVCIGQAPLLAQVRPPGRHHRDDLEQRYNDLKCALVIVQNGGEFGTGVFIGSDGDIATASHVLGDRTFTSQADGTITTNLALPASLTVIDSQGKSTTVPGQA